MPELHQPACAGASGAPHKIERFDGYFLIDAAWKYTSQCLHP
jgi:hypothetical protein